MSDPSSVDAQLRRLHLAARKGHHQEMHSILSNNPRLIYARSLSEGRTVIHVLAETKFSRIMEATLIWGKMIYEMGFHDPDVGTHIRLAYAKRTMFVDTENSMDETCVHIAVSNGSLEMVRTIFEVGSKLFGVEPLQNTLGRSRYHERYVFYHAVIGRHIEIVKYLAEWGRTHMYSEWLLGEVQSTFPVIIGSGIHIPRTVDMIMVLLSMSEGLNRECVLAALEHEDSTVELELIIFLGASIDDLLDTESEIDDSMDTESENNFEINDDYGDKQFLVDRIENEDPFIPIAIQILRCAYSQDEILRFLPRGYADHSVFNAIISSEERREIRNRIWFDRSLLSICLLWLMTE